MQAVTSGWTAADLENGWPRDVVALGAGEPAVKCNLLRLDQRCSVLAMDLSYQSQP